MRHFGGGQTEIPLELEPGEHTLQLLFRDANHVSFDPPVTGEPITITVEMSRPSRALPRRPTPLTHQTPALLDDAA